MGNKTSGPNNTNGSTTSTTGLTNNSAVETKSLTAATSSVTGGRNNYAKAIVPIAKNQLNKDSSEADVIAENMRIFNLSNKKDWTTRSYKMPIYAGADLRLSPGVTRHMYKVVRVKINNEISDKVGVLLTLLINSHKTKISLSHECKEQPFGALVPKEKYCVQTAAVVAAQFIGDYEQVNFAMNVLNRSDTDIRFVSNFNTTNKDFEYVLGTEIVEENAFQEGTGCLQGIHAFVDEKSAMKYVYTGLIHAMHSPVISSKVCMLEATKDEEKNVDHFRHLFSYNDVIMFKDEPRHIRKKKLEKIKNTNIYFYEYSIDANEQVVHPSSDMEISVTETEYDNTGMEMNSLIGNIKTSLESDECKKMQ